MENSFNGCKVSFKRVTSPVLEFVAIVIVTDVVIGGVNGEDLK